MDESSAFAGIPMGGTFIAKNESNQPTAGTSDEAAAEPQPTIFNKILPVLTTAPTSPESRICL